MLIIPKSNAKIRSPWPTKYIQVIHSGPFLKYNKFSYLDTSPHCTNRLPWPTFYTLVTWLNAIITWVLYTDTTIKLPTLYLDTYSVFHDIIQYFHFDDLHCEKEVLKVVRMNDFDDLDCILCTIDLVKFCFSGCFKYMC